MVEMTASWSIYESSILNRCMHEDSRQSRRWAYGSASLSLRRLCIETGRAYTRGLYLLVLNVLKSTAIVVERCAYCRSNANRCQRLSVRSALWLGACGNGDFAVHQDFCGERGRRLASFGRVLAKFS